MTLVFEVSIRIKLSFTVKHIHTHTKQSVNWTLPIPKEATELCFSAHRCAYIKGQEALVTYKGQLNLIHRRWGDHKTDIDLV